MSKELQKFSRQQFSPKGQWFKKLVSLVKSVRASSLRVRFFITSCLLLLFLLPVVIHTEKMVTLAAKRSSQVNANLNSFQTIINQLERSLQSTERSIYHYSVVLEDSIRQDANKALSRAKQLSKHLPEHEVSHNNQELTRLIKQLGEQLADLDKETKHLMQVLARVETRYPAAPILLESLQPTSEEFISAIELAIIESNELAHDPVQEKITLLYREIRYAWAQQVSSVRVYIANRSGIFGHPERSMADNAINRKLYAAQVEELLGKLQDYDKAGRLGFQQSISLQRMIKSVKQYEYDFRRAARIYTSENWRADVPILSKKIRPIFRGIWASLLKIEKSMDAMSTNNVSMLVKVSNSLGDILLLLIFFVGLVLLLGFLLVEFVIRRPIVEVTKALEAEGRGETYSPSISGYTTTETDVMIDAFSRMREQVRSRQKRLESILDNAGEGIITLDAEGKIETFNSAAQQLFGYSTLQALGQPVDSIIKLTETHIHDGFLQFCKYHSPYGRTRINETVLSVEHKDGTPFPMSINVSDLWVEGRQLFIAIVEDISERMALMENLRMMAEHDSLTGLYNREYFMTELDRLVENIKRGTRSDHALLYLDLDNFKFVNDTLGHLAGDQLLIEVTDMLSRRTRKSDMLARLGGDEFALLIYGAEKEQVIHAAESYRKLLADYMFKYDGKTVNIGCSIGVAMFGQELMLREDILVQADIACHVAKRSGRNRIHVYRSDDKENMAAMSADMGWAARIKRAIDEDRFLIACQPIIDVHTNKVSRHEVLLRLLGDDGTIIQPSGFLSSAERFGLMRSIDRWVIEHAIETLGKRLRRDPHVCFSINLSAKSLEDSTMLQVITDALQQNGVSPTSITFEITENVAIANLPTAVDFLNHLREMGCQTALDDFGVGYSSFTYLKDLPVDLVKIDGSFVRNMQKDVLQLAMVRSMNDIAHALGKSTVAEYVDNKECYLQLKDIGVDYVQGYYTGKPSIINYPTRKNPARKNPTRKTALNTA